MRKIFLYQMYTNLAYVPPTYRRVQNLRVLIINKYVRKSLACKKGNENPIWIWNYSTRSATDSSLDPSSFPSITTLPIQMRTSPNLCVVSPLRDSVTTNTVMASLQVFQSLEIGCLCINGFIHCYANWGRLHGNGKISWLLQNLFTSPILRSLFNIIHP